MPPALGEFPGSAARAPPRPLGPPPALAHSPAVRLRRPGGCDFRAVPRQQGAPPSRTAAWAGRPGGPSAATAAAAGAQQPASPSAARLPAGPPPPPGAMAGSSSLEAVRRKIRSLQEQADTAEERAGSLQRELDYERKLRETVRDPPITHPRGRLPRRPPHCGRRSPPSPPPLPPPRAAPGAPGPAGVGLWGGALPVLRSPSFSSLWSKVKEPRWEAGVMLRSFWKQHFLSQKGL